MCTAISYSLTPCFLDHHLPQLSLSGQMLNYRLMQLSFDVGGGRFLQLQYVRSLLISTDLY